MNTKTNKLISYRQSVLKEFVSWARLPMETKFGVALGLLVLAFFLGGFVPAVSSALNVWGVIVFFEALLQSQLKWEKEDQREILKTYLYAGILGTLAGSFLLLYFDVFYFLRLSVIDFLTRYIWFLLPLSNLTKKVKTQNKKGLDVSTKA
ncbi:MAG: hypothetical protein V1690_03985 [Candidatus Moraniibacteriota bacterium]